MVVELVEFVDMVMFDFVEFILLLFIEIEVCVFIFDVEIFFILGVLFEVIEVLGDELGLIENEFGVIEVFEKVKMRIDENLCIYWWWFGLSIFGNLSDFKMRWNLWLFDYDLNVFLDSELWNLKGVIKFHN